MAILGLDLGGTKLAALVKDKAELQDVLILPKVSNFDVDAESIARFLQKLIAKTNSKIDRCVCSIAATLDASGNVVCWPNRKHWEGNNIKKIFDCISCEDITFEDDGNAAAYAEANARNIDNLFYLGIGTGVGGGIVLNKKILKGASNRAAEFGHISVIPDGKICNCGKKGCLQAYASGVAVLKNAYGDNWIAKTKLDLQADLAKNIAEVIKAVDVAAEMLARVLVNLNEIIDIRTCVIGGGLGADFSELHQRIEFFMSQLARNYQPKIELLPARCRENSSLEGAILLAQNSANL